MSHKQCINPYEIEFEMEALVEVFSDETEKEGNISTRQEVAGK